ncbi:MAG: hypothetical protein WAN18_16870, partial [Candidatus Sulfotelmatobacter sp.]
MSIAGLANLCDASHFHDWGFLLPLCKTGGLLMIRVGAGKPLTVIVKHSHLPVMVFSPFVFTESRTLPNGHSNIYITSNILSTNEPFLWPGSLGPSGLCSTLDLSDHLVGCQDLTEHEATESVGEEVDSQVAAP